MPSKLEKAFLDESREFIQSYINSDYVSGDPVVNVDFYKSSKFKAQVYKEHDQYFIKISDGASCILLDLFLRMLAHKEIFPEIGKPQNEVVDFPTVNNYLIDANDLAYAGKDPHKFELIAPVDPQRVAFAFYLYKAALAFIFQHELSHVLNGHIDYLTKDKKLFVYDEFNSKKVAEDEASIRRALEMDADSTAMNRCVNLCYLRLKDSNSFPEAQKPFHQDIYQELGYLWFVVNTLYIFWSIHEIDADPKFKKHPPVEERRSYTCLGSLDFIEKIRPNTVDKTKLNRVFVESCISSIKAYKSTVQDPKNFTDKLVLGKYSDYYENIRKTWASIRDDLQKFSYKELAPAVS